MSSVKLFFNMSGVTDVTMTCPLAVAGLDPESETFTFSLTTLMVFPVFSEVGLTRSSPVDLLRATQAPCSICVLS